MHRGSIFIITKNNDNKFQVEKSTEFNGGMGIENLGGAIYDMLRKFNGAIISISHDRKYIAEVIDNLYILTPKGLIKQNT